PLNVAIYISFFPQLIAGPIVRYSTISEQISSRRENLDCFSDGVYRFMVGFCKKVIIANNVALVADAAFGSDKLSTSMAWLGALAYTLQIFFDFSGYSDMAIGLGKMFGFDFLENFNYPYISASVSEFWRRWHISLGSWFRDYVYIPLGGSRVKKPRLIFNLFVVWFLTGLWHGAEWTFIVWGLMYFVLLTLEKTTGFNKKIGPFKYIYTIFFVVIGWVIFRSENITQAYEYIKAMFGIGVSGFSDGSAKMYFSYYKAYIIAGILNSFPIMTFVKSKIKINENLYTVLSWLVLLVLFAVALTFTVKGSYNPFIYFNF
ncbi:MAG: MBOAT family protein, partial [Clostridia bacterium]|nr:MBOAT family protein [Clostridia bacterium]